MRWLGVLPRDVLAEVYAAADVFVMPSRSETFGLVMLEAMATGTPVAAFPVEGPLEVVGSPPVGGVLDDDLARAWYAALTVPRHVARQRAQAFGWAYASQLFVSHLVPARNGSLLDKPPLRRDHLRRGRDLRPRIPLRRQHSRRAVPARRADIALRSEKLFTAEAQRKSKARKAYPALQSSAPPRLCGKASTSPTIRMT